MDSPWISLNTWAIIKYDLVVAIQNFHEDGLFGKSSNAIIVAIILRTTGAVELNDCRPISLIRGVYKTIGKLLAERLKKVVHKLVDRHQMAFIKGRWVLSYMQMSVWN